MRKKYIIMVIVGFIVLCALYLLIVVYPRQGKTPVEVLVHPKNADVYIDGKKHGSGTVYLRQGLHTFKAEEPGWRANQVDVTVTSKPMSVALLPEPVSGEAFAQADKDSELREGLYGIAADTRGLDIRNQYPVLNSLPYSDVAGPFKIDYGFDESDNKTPYMIVSYSTPNGRREAIEWLTAHKVDTTMQEIVFEDFINPIHPEKHSD